MSLIISITEIIQDVTVTETAVTITVAETVANVGGGGGGATNLSYTSSATQGQVNSDTGTDAVLPLATTSIAGLLKPADFTKLSNLSGANTGDQTTIVGITGTKAEFDTAVTDGNFAYQSDLANYQPLDTDLTAIAGLTSAANKVPYSTGSGTWSLADFTSLARTLLAISNPSAVRFYKINADNTITLRTAAEMLSDIGAQASGNYLVTTNNLSDVSNAGTARSNLGLAIGSNVQAWDADLDALAALSGTNTIYYRSASNTWTAVTIGNNLTFSSGTLSASAGGQDGSKIKFEDDFWRGSSLGGGDIEWTGRSFGTGAASVIGVAGEAKHTGIVRLNTGTDTTGRGVFSTYDNTDEVSIPDGDFIFEVIVKTPSSLSDGTDTYTLRFGLNTSNAGIGSNACIVRYSNGVNSGKWEFVYASGGTEYTIDSGTSVAAATWYRLKFTVVGTTFSGYVNGSAAGTPVTVTAIGAGNRQGIIFSNAKTAGTNDRIAYVDYVYYEQSASR